MIQPRGPTVVNQFDAEGRPVLLKGVAAVSDALGRAVGAGGQEFVYGPGAAKLAVVNGQTLVRADIPLPGAETAVYDGGGLQYFRMTDGLGSARLELAAGAWIYSSAAYAAYGQGYAGSGTGDVSFTGKQSDIAAGSYDFPAREYSPIMARWWKPDPAGLSAVDPANPQSWDRYAYALGNPLTNTDPTGLDPCPPGSAIQYCFSTTGTPKTPPPLPFIDAGVPDELTGLEDGLYAVPNLLQFNTNQPLPPANPGNPSFTVGRNPATSPPPSVPNPTPGQTQQATGARPPWLNTITSIFGCNQNDPRPSCFGDVFLKTAASNLNPLQFSPADVAKGAAAVGSAAVWNQALDYAAAKQLTSPFKSSVFRSLASDSAQLGSTAAVEIPAVWAFASVAIGFYEEMTASARGACQ